MPDFESGAFNRSAISPFVYYQWVSLLCKAGLTTLCQFVSRSTDSLWQLRDVDSVDSGREVYRCDHKVEKRARLRRKMVTRWMQRIERKSLIKPIRKDNLQAS